ncbi:tRNA uridine-5-carboxymethylaminomethyl(34) synthesis GTPase MnmE [Ichthyobacterium seriolicida]|uniref:tRNA modification GTPase MnmE n=1 Tax=Ichthyobacterium seriolicida TaxID=242600 RepID=A0A1J1DWY5_9FLAO|nr:tRNA uridine-5-carboxymethylaminomethyl(34) synthesis GTPase MnmE [Ichthyobacterium seriolicida]BAV94370.1 GTPase and tRNA-U34 5-formylation enzyme TrmE [Ichthyobacterium seriolicida]
MIDSNTIIAVSTAPGIAAIAVIRLSGPDAIKVTDEVFHPSNGHKKLCDRPTHTISLGLIKQGEDIIDEVLISIFRAPKSYTGENVVEISCHGSTYIKQRIIQLFIDRGVSLAKPGEFTLRAFLNGKMNLSQAEAVADVISSENQLAHQTALQQMRGEFSNDLKQLRQKLINFASLIELELDFSQEDVEFADRSELLDLLNVIELKTKSFIDSFSLGNAIKCGINVVIVGAPNSGKSTLLNALFNEEKAIVSDIAGTTRDVIEDELVIDGISFRFIDTAGIRKTENQIEKIGVQKTFEKIDVSRIVIYVLDSTDDIEEKKEKILDIKRQLKSQILIVLANKIDLVVDKKQLQSELIDFDNVLYISAKNKEGIDQIPKLLRAFVDKDMLKSGSTVISNIRHYESLLRVGDSIDMIKKGLNEGFPQDLIALDIRSALNNLGLITGEVTNEDLLGNIFQNFCIGK